MSNYLYLTETKEKEALLEKASQISESVKKLFDEVEEKDKVFYDLWSEENDYIEHINLGLKADCMVIAPCTSNTISKIALGVSDDPVSTTALSIRKKLLIAPAMDGEMFEKFSTQNNIFKFDRKENSSNTLYFKIKHV